MKDAAFVMDEFNFWTAALSEKEIKDAIGMFETFRSSVFLSFFLLSPIRLLFRSGRIKRERERLLDRFSLVMLCSQPPTRRTLPVERTDLRVNTKTDGPGYSIG